jgi:hypothetical protein
MKKLFGVLFFLIATSATAQQWSFGAGAGPFFFGDFVRRTMRIGNEGGSELQTSTLSAATRAGVSLDLERSFGERFAVRAEAAFTRSPLAIKGGGSEVEVEAGDLDVLTLMVPLVVRINPRGSLRFHIMGGPAHAAYRVSKRSNAALTIPTFTGTRSDWGLAFGGGVAWQWSERFAIEGQITDIATESPFDESDFGGLASVEIPKPHNIHSTLGIRYRF